MKSGETVELTELTPAAGSTAMSGLIASHPNLTAVWTLQEPLALGARSVARSSGKDIFITSENGSKVAIEAVASGNLGATYRYNGYEVGVQAARAAYLAQTGQKTPKIIVVPGTAVTKENADEVLSELE